MRALLFFLLIVLLFVLVRFVMKRIQKFRDEELAQEEAESKQKEVVEEEMVACEECGVHLPKSDAYIEVTDDSTETKTPHYFCSEAHLKAYLEKK